MQQMLHGKSKGGMVFCSLFQEHSGNKFINYSINFLCKLIIFHTGIDQHKDV